MDTKNTAFRLIFAIREISDQVKPGSYFRLTVAGANKKAQLPLREALVFDLNSLPQNSIIEFTLENESGEIYGYSELNVPNEVYQNQETELNENLKIYVGNEGSQTIQAKIYLVFLNKGMFKEKAKQKGSTPQSKSSSQAQLYENTPKTPNQSATQGSNKKTSSVSPLDKQRTNSLSQAYTPSPSKGNLGKRGSSPPSKSNLSRGMSKTDEVKFDMYLNQIVGKHAQDIQREQTEPETFSRALETSYGSPLKERIDTLQTSVKQDENLDLSPERLKVKFDAGESRSFVEERPSVSSPKKQTQELQTAIDKAAATIAYQKAQIDHLKNVVLTLDTKAKQLEMIKNENNFLKEEFAKLEDARKDLQGSIMETTAELKQENTSLQKQIVELIREKEDLINRNEDLMHNLKEAHEKMDKMQATIDKKTADLKEYEFKVSQMGKLQKHIDHLESALATAEKKRADDQSNFLNTLKNLEKSLEETKEIINGLTQEKRELLRELNETKSALAKEKADHVDTQRANTLLQKKLENAEKHKEAVKSLQEQRDEYKKVINESQVYHADLNKLIESSREELATKTREFEGEEKKYLKEISLLREKLNQYETNNNIYKQQIADDKATISELKSNISSLEQLLVVKEDVNKQLDAVTGKLAIVLKDKETLTNQIEVLIQSQTIATNKTLDLERQIFELKSAIIEKDDYIANLKKLILEMKEKQSLYIPKRGDIVDSALADYINSSTDPGPLRTLFLREAEGVYQFGTKRVHLKLEGEKICVRVGGGFLPIEEFAEQYVPIELEKISKSDPVKILIKNPSPQPKSMGKTLEKSKTMSSNKDTSPRVKRSGTKDY